MVTLLFFLCHREPKMNLTLTQIVKCVFYVCADLSLGLLRDIMYTKRE